MNTNANVRIIVGCSILVAVCQTAANAGGPGSMGASHLGSGVSHVNIPSSVFKTPTGSNVQTGCISFKDKLSVNSGIYQKLPSSPTGTKVPGSGLTFNDKLKLQPGLKLGNGTIPPSGGTTPPSSGKPSPMKKDKDHDDFPYWLWFTPAFYGNGYGNWGYPAAPVYSQVSVSSPVVVEQTPVTPMPADSTSTDKLTMKLGESYTIANDHFGERAGDLSLAISGLTLPVRVDNWTAQEISFTLPGVGLAKATDGVFQISNSDHQLTKAVPVTVVPAR